MRTREIQIILKLFFGFLKQGFFVTQAGLLNSGNPQPLTLSTGIKGVWTTMRFFFFKQVYLQNRKPSLCSGLQKQWVWGKAIHKQIMFLSKTTSPLGLKNLLSLSVKLGWFQTGQIWQIWTVPPDDWFLAKVSWGHQELRYDLYKRLSILFVLKNNLTVQVSHSRN